MLSKIMLRRMRKDVAPDMPKIDFQFLPLPVASVVDLPYRPAEWLIDNLDEAREARPKVAIAKVPGLVDNIRFALDNGLIKQTVVFGWHIKALEMLHAALVSHGYSVGLLYGGTASGLRVDIQDDFKVGKLDVIVANIQAAGTAIDLSAASHGYFLELDWVPGNNMQAANRLVSMAKREKVTFDIATWPGSIDDAVQRVLLRRAQDFDLLHTTGA
jgi:hypothetical protein